MNFNYFLKLTQTDYYGLSWIINNPNIFTTKYKQVSIIHNWYKMESKFGGSAYGSFSFGHMKSNLKDVDLMHFNDIFKLTQTDYYDSLWIIKNPNMFTMKYYQVSIICNGYKTENRFGGSAYGCFSPGHTYGGVGGGLASFDRDMCAN